MENLVAEWQARHDVSNTQLAKLLKCHPSLITLLKKGRRNWTPAKAEAMEIISGGEIHRLDLLYPSNTNYKFSIVQYLKRLLLKNH